MFSHSYNPSFEQLSPGSSSDLRKREEQARRQRLLEQANRRRLARLERIRRMEEQLRKEEMARETEIYNWQHKQAEEDQQRHDSRLDLLSLEEGDDRGDDDIMLASSYPPQFIYATISNSQEEVEESTKPPPKMPSLGLEGQNMHRRSRYCNDVQVPSINLQAQHSRQEDVQEVSADEKMEINEDSDTTSVPPHIIANDVSDDDNEDDDDDDILNSIWDIVPSIPPPPWLDPSDKYRTCE